MTIINASRSRTLREQVLRIAANGYANWGYGGSIATQPINPGDTVSVDEFNKLVSALQRINRHQKGSKSTSIANTSTSNLIADSASNIAGDHGSIINDPLAEEKSWNNLETLVKELEETRFQVHPTNVSNELTLSDSRSGNWNGVIYSEFTVSFNNKNHRRHFFNTGGKIRLSAFLQSPALPKGHDWRRFLGSIGLVVFDYNSTAVSDTVAEIGNYQLTDDFQTLFERNNTGDRSDDKIVVQAKSTTTSITFRVQLEDNTDDDAVDGNLQLEVSQARSTGEFEILTPGYTQDVSWSDTVLFPVVPSFALTADKEVVVEGESVRITLNTEDQPTNVPYIITGIQESDLEKVEIDGNTVATTLENEFIIEPGKQESVVELFLLADGIPQDNTLVLTLTNGKASVSVKVEDAVMPVDEGVWCISILDDDSDGKETIQREYDKFKKEYPNRRLYVLQVPRKSTIVRYVVPSLLYWGFRHVRRNQLVDFVPEGTTIGIDNRLYPVSRTNLESRYEYYSPWTLRGSELREWDRLGIFTNRVLTEEEFQQIDSSQPINTVLGTQHWLNRPWHPWIRPIPWVFSETQTQYVDLTLPAQWKNDDLAFGPIEVSRDTGDPELVSDWYDLCDLDEVPDNYHVAFSVDVSGSMTRKTVEAALDLVKSRLEERDITWTDEDMPSENFVKGHNRQYP